MQHIEGLKSIGTRHLEEMEPDIPKEVLVWLENFKGVDDEMGYPVVLNSAYGFLAGLEYWHDEMEDIGSPTSDWKVENPQVKCKDVLVELEETAKLLQVLEPNLQVFVGNKTAPLDSHEFSIFFPFGTTNEKYEVVLNSWKYAELKTKEEKLRNSKD